MLVVGARTGAASDSFRFTAPRPFPRETALREPSIAIAPDGTVHAVALGGEPGGAVHRFRSSDGGRAYDYAGSTSSRFAGRDADVAVAPVRNELGHHTIFAVDLWRGSIALEVSRDGGVTWSVNPAVAQIPNGGWVYEAGSAPLSERPWVEAEGADSVYLSYTGLAVFVMRCTAFPGPVCGPPTYAGGGGIAGPNGFWPGGLALDRTTGRLFQAYLSSGRTGSLTQVWMAVSDDGARTFRRSLVYENAAGVSLDGYFPVASVDLAGNVYATWSDRSSVFLAGSADGGSTWGTPVRVNQAPSSTARLPWIAGGSAGIVDVVWYGTDDAGHVWYPYFAQVRNALTTAPSIRQAALTSTPVFLGELRRELLDFFEVAIDPVDGAAVTAFTSALGTARVNATRQCAGPSAIEGRTVSPC